MLDTKTEISCRRKEKTRFCAVYYLFHLKIVSSSKEEQSLLHDTLLFRSLASTDLCVGLTSQPCFITDLRLNSIETKVRNS